MDEKLLQKQVDEYELTRRIYAVRTLQILERALIIKGQEIPVDAPGLSALGLAIASVLNSSI